MSILITAANHSSAHKLARLLNSPDVIFADYTDNSQLKYSGKRFITIPAGNSSSYAHELLTICLNLKIEKIYPLYIDEMKALSEAKQLFNEYGIKVIVPDMDHLENLGITAVPAKFEFLIIADSKIVAGNPTESLNLPEGLEAGIFWINFDQLNPVIKLFAIA